MALNLYIQTSFSNFSEIRKAYDSESEDLPLITTHDGSLGEVVETMLFLRNNDPDEYYTGISVTAVCDTVPDDTIGTETGHGVKLRAGHSQPTEAEWECIDYANSITFDNIGGIGSPDISSYFPFWYRVEVPPGTPADNKENIFLRVFGTAHPALPIFE